MDFLNHMLKKHKQTAVAILGGILVLVILIVSNIQAAAPPGGYSPGATNDPDCAPNDTDCLVDIPTGLGTENVPNGNVSVGSDTGDVADGFDNTFLGISAGNVNDGGGNVFIGTFTGAYNTTAEGLAFLGSYSGVNNITAKYNTFLGAYSGAENDGSAVATFAQIALMADPSESNTFVGYSSGIKNKTGNNNAYIGVQTGAKGETSSNNVAIGSQAGFENIAGSGNVFLGYKAGFNETGSDKLYIANSDTATPLIFGDFAGSALTINGDLEITGTCIGCVPYEKYVALLTQSGSVGCSPGDPYPTDPCAPQAIVLENTLGGTVVWTRGSDGSYVATLAGAFTENKTFVLASPFLSLTFGSWKLSWASNDSINLQTQDATGNFADSILDGSDGGTNSIEIRVYP